MISQSLLFFDINLTKVEIVELHKSDIKTYFWKGRSPEMVLSSPHVFFNNGS